MACLLQAGRDDRRRLGDILPAATNTATIKILARRVRGALQVALRVLTVATQKVFLVKTFGDGFYEKEMTCHPERSEGTHVYTITPLILVSK